MQVKLHAFLISAVQGGELSLAGLVRPLGLKIRGTLGRSLREILNIRIK
jgi:hypothetical protein